MSVQYGIPALFAFGDIKESSPLHAAPLEYSAAEEEPVAADESAEESGVYGQVATGQAEAIRVLYQAGLKSA